MTPLEKKYPGVTEFVSLINNNSIKKGDIITPKIQGETLVGMWNTDKTDWHGFHYNQVEPYQPVKQGDLVEVSDHKNFPKHKTLQAEFLIDASISQNYKGSFPIRSIAEDGMVIANKYMRPIPKPDTSVTLPDGRSGKLKEKLFNKVKKVVDAAEK